MIPSTLTIYNHRAKNISFYAWKFLRSYLAWGLAGTLAASSKVLLCNLQEAIPHYLPGSPLLELVYFGASMVGRWRLGSSRSCLQWPYIPAWQVHTRQKAAIQRADTCARAKGSVWLGFTLRSDPVLLKIERDLNPLYALTENYTYLYSSVPWGYRYKHESEIDHKMQRNWESLSSTSCYQMRSTCDMWNGSLQELLISPTGLHSSFISPPKHGRGAVRSKHDLAFIECEMNAMRLLRYSSAAYMRWLWSSILRKFRRRPRDRQRQVYHCLPNRMPRPDSTRPRTISKLTISSIKCRSYLGLESSYL